jgi:hypothetical protein
VREPDRYVARLNAGRYRLALGDVDGAGRDFAAAHERLPEAAAPLVGLSRVAHARGDRVAAQRWLRGAEKADGNEPEVRAWRKELER